MIKTMGSCMKVSFVCLLVVSIASLSAARIRHVIYNITERLPQGHVIGDLVTDCGLDDEYDPRQLDDLQFKTLSNPRVNISLIPGTGRLQVSGDIDREFLCPTAVYCDVTQDIHVSLEGVSHFSILKITFHIYDRNDNSPEFVQKVFYKNLLENTPLGTLITLPYAEDKDSRRYGVKEYQLHPNRDYFSLQIKNNADGSQDVHMRLDKPLDYEKRKAVNLTLIAYDGGNPRKSGSLDIVVVILDANDHIPVFENSTYEVHIAENIAIGSTLLRVRATDADTGRNSAISYRFSQRSHDAYGAFFTIGELTGDIIVRNVIDYEIRTEFHLSVIGQDLGPNPHSADTTVIVHISDENDCFPFIAINTLNDNSAEIGVAKILEESDVGTFVAFVSVSDGDSGVFGEVTCNLVSSFFSLQNLDNNEYQIVTSVIFDREIRDVYEVLLKCKDGGPDPNLSTQRIQVRILDINDHAPKFSKQEYVENVIENNYAGHTVARLNASDPDFGKNAQLSYSLDLNMLSLFNINRETGLISALQSFDRETQDRFILTVVVQDGGDESLSASCTVIVNIIDVNDEKPQFLQSLYQFNISESSQPGSIIGAVSAFDKDRSPYNEVSYSITEDNAPSRSFSIDAISGEIKTVHALDREKKASFTLHVVASDAASSALTSTVVAIVTLRDVNDNAPVFSFPSHKNHTVQIPTKIPSGYAVARLIASDLDQGQNGRIIFTIESGGTNFFIIGNRSGVIMASKALRLTHNDMFSLRVRARDQGKPPLHTTAHLNILVNKSIVIGASGSSARGRSAIGTNLHIVIIVSSALACVIFILVISIMCIYCRKTPHETKPETEYDQFKVRDETMETFHDTDGSFDSLQKHNNSHSVEYAGPTSQRYTPAPHYTMDDSGFQADEIEYHQRYPASGHVNNNQRSPRAFQASPYRTEQGNKKNEVSMRKRDMDQDSTYSGDGSNPDSGKGPSEEGDNATIMHPQGQVMPAVLPPVLEEEHRACDVTSACQNGTQPCCAKSSSLAQYGFVRNTQPYITGIAMCKCKSCHSHNIKGSTGANTPSSGQGIQLSDITHTLPKPSRSIDSVPRPPPRVPSRSDNTRLGISQFGSCRDIDNDFKTPPSYRNQFPISVHNPTYVSRNVYNHTIKPHVINNHSGSTTLSNNHKVFNRNRTNAPPDCHQTSFDKDDLDLNSSSTSGSYMVENLDMSDVMNDSHWNIRDSVV